MSGAPLQRSWTGPHLDRRMLGFALALAGIFVVAFALGRATHSTGVANVDQSSQATVASGVASIPAEIGTLPPIAAIAPPRVIRPAPPRAATPAARPAPVLAAPVPVVTSSAPPPVHQSAPAPVAPAPRPAPAPAPAPAPSHSGGESGGSGGGFDSSG